MAVLFITNPGVAVQLPAQSAMPLSIALDGWGGFQGFKSIITQASVQQQGGFQFLHTLRDFIFVYVFGERMGQCTIHGVSFAYTCPGRGGMTGPEAILQYYNNSRITKAGVPGTIQIGTTAAGRMRGFMTGMKLELTDPQQHLSQFSLQFHKFPAE